MMINDDDEYPGPCLNIGIIFPRYGDSHVKDKTVVSSIDDFNLAIVMLKFVDTWVIFIPSNSAQ